ncbi:MAG: HD domain-containing protein [Candidatus Caldatribacteriota bacterium]|nr:HD domain-containing protein [Candidatus Caldatribacteriota bacterium]
MDKESFKREIIDFEDNNLSPYAVKNFQARRKRKISSSFRGPYSRDRDHILYSGSFRRYIGKTQVIYFASSIDEQLSNRSIHTLQVSQIARTIGKALRLNIDLIEAIALGHDLGHTPFGHDGEEILQEICREKKISLFFHNIHSLRIVDKLADSCRGMNLTFQVRDGILSHDGEINEKYLKPNRSKSEIDLTNYCKQKYQGEEAQTIPATLEGCVVRMSDAISYLGQDFEDAIRIGILKKEELPEGIKKELGKRNADIINSLVVDIIKNSNNQDKIIYSPNISERVFELKRFNLEKIYKNPELKMKKNKLKSAFKFLFNKFLNDINTINEDSLIYREWIFNRGKNKGGDYVNSNSSEQIVIDFIASMTDRYFYNAYKKYRK